MKNQDDNTQRQRDINVDTLDREITFGKVKGTRLESLSEQEGVSNPDIKRLINTIIRTKELKDKFIKEITNEFDQ